MPFKFTTIDGSLQTAKRKKNIKIPTFSLDQVGTVSVKTVFEVDGEQVSTSTLLNVPRVLVDLLDELSKRGISDSNEPKIRGVFRETMSIAKRKSFFSQNTGWFGGFNHLSLETFSVIELGDIVKSFLRDLNGFAIKTSGRIFTNLCQQTLQKNECIEFHMDSLPHLGTMIYLLQKLNTLTHGTSSSMTFHNLATIFAPILFRTGSHEETLSIMKTTVRITEVLISRAQQIAIARSRSSSVPVRNKAVDGCIGLFRHRRGFSKDRQQTVETRPETPSIEAPMSGGRASRSTVRLRTPGGHSNTASPSTGLTPKTRTSGTSGLTPKAVASAIPPSLSMSTPKSTTVRRKTAPTLSFSTPKTTSVVYTNQGLLLSSPLTESFKDTEATNEPKEGNVATEATPTETKITEDFDILDALNNFGSLSLEEKPEKKKIEEVKEQTEVPTTSLSFTASEAKATESFAAFKTPSSSDFATFKTIEKAAQSKSTASFAAFKTPSSSDFASFKNTEKAPEPKSTQSFSTFKTPSFSDFNEFKDNEKVKEEEKKPKEEEVFRSGDPFTDENEVILRGLAHFGRPSLVFAQGRGIVTAALQRLNTEKITDGNVTYSRSEKTKSVTVKKNVPSDAKKPYNSQMFKRPY